MIAGFPSKVMREPVIATLSLGKAAVFWRVPFPMCITEKVSNDAHFCLKVSVEPPCNDWRQHLRALLLSPQRHRYSLDYSAKKSMQKSEENSFVQIIAPGAYCLAGGLPEMEILRRYRRCGIIYIMNVSRYFPVDRLSLICAVQTRMKRFRVCLPLVALLCLPGPAAGSTAFRFDSQNEVLGAIDSYTVKNNESLYEIARTYNTGFNEIVAANPGIDPYVPGKGTSLILPTSWILPDTSRAPGIVVNLSEMRFYYFFKKKNGTVMVKTYPIGIGEEGYDTPLGTFTVVEKIAHPAWYVPVSIRKEKPELPDVVPPGPDNPMGSHALRLSRRTVLIHGTDVPWGIGRRVSHGCIRLYPEDIVELFRIVPLKTPVTIVQQPVKVGVSRGRVYVAVSEDEDLRSFDYASEAVSLLRKRGLLDRVSMDKLAKAIRQKRGFPLDVSFNNSAGPGEDRAPR